MWLMTAAHEAAALRFPKRWSTGKVFRPTRLIERLVEFTDRQPHYVVSVYGPVVKKNGEDHLGLRGHTTFIKKKSFDDDFTLDEDFFL